MTAHVYEAPLLAHARGLALDAGAPLPETVEAGVAWLDAHGRGRDLGKFARRTPLPRVVQAIEALRALAPATLLDVGPGRYGALWPLWEALATTTFTVADPPKGEFPGRAPELLRMKRGGLARLDDARAVPAEDLAGWGDDAFEAVTALEVLEHVGDPFAAAREFLRVARRAVVLSVPCQPDSNPDHVRLFTHPSVPVSAARCGTRPTVPLDAPWHAAAAALGVAIELDVRTAPATAGPHATPRHFVAVVTKRPVR